MLFSYNGRGHVLRTRAYNGQIEVLISGVAITNPPFGVHKGEGDVFIKGASSIEFVYAAPSRTYGWIV
jgi:predicted RNA methylase